MTKTKDDTTGFHPPSPSENRLDSEQIIHRAGQCLQIEIDAIQATRRGLGAEFVQVVREIDACLVAGRKLIFTGVGKSAHICQKLVGTFNSITARSSFLDSTQALHGDLGLCVDGDLAILVSNSGETEELLRLAPILRRLGLKTAAMTSQPESALCEICDLAIYFRVPREACPLHLAPTASTTASLALGDALAMVYLEMKGFTEKDFARFHPAGNLGRSLLLRVADIMRSGTRFPVLPETAVTREAILAMTRAKAGSLALVSAESQRLSGIFTDGDFRRATVQSNDCLDRPVAEFMTRNPKTIEAEAMAVEALKLFEKYRIDDLIVVDRSGVPVGVIDNQDLPRLRII